MTTPRLAHWGWAHLIWHWLFAIAILVSSRAENTQTVSGLMTVVMMPMFVLSGVFFSSAHFPELMQPLISILDQT